MFPIIMPQPQAPAHRNSRLCPFHPFSGSFHTFPGSVFFLLAGFSSAALHIFLPPACGAFFFIFPGFSCRPFFRQHLFPAVVQPGRRFPLRSFSGLSFFLPPFRLPSPRLSPCTFFFYPCPVFLPNPFPGFCPRIIFFSPWAALLSAFSYPGPGVNHIPSGK